MAKHLVLCLILILFTFYSNNTLAQGERNNWYFGSVAGIKFVNNEPTADVNGAIDTWEGCASISNSSGELLFYTDGIFVRDSSHYKMPNGSGLYGDPSSSQSSLIVPKPNNEGKYYIFTIDDVDPSGGFNGLNYSLIDMKLNDSLGDVVASEKNINLHKPMCEKIAAAKHINGTDVWVVTQKWGTNHFYTFLVTEDAVDTVPVISSSGLVIGGDGFGIDVAKGYLKISHDGNKIVKANAGLRSIEFFDFDNATGYVSNGFSDEDVECEPYGVEFSPNNRYVYVGSWKGNPEMLLFQYDIEAGSQIEIRNSRVTIFSGTNGALQMGPDNKIYVANAQEKYLSRINYPDKPGDECGFEFEAVNLENRASMWGLPNFVSVPADTTVGIYQTTERQSSPLEIYPNPANDNFSVSLNDLQAKFCTVAIYNCNGQEVEKLKLTSGSPQIVNTSKWIPGLYVAFVFNENRKIGQQKFFIR